MSYVNSCEFLLITRNEQKKYKDNSGAFLTKKKAPLSGNVRKMGKEDIDPEHLEKIQKHEEEKEALADDEGKEVEGSNSQVEEGEKTLEELKE